MEHPDFRVRGKIFATLGYPDAGSGMVKLTPEQQQVFVSIEPAVFEPVKGGWGRQGNTTVRLEAASEATLQRALLTAWGNAASKRLAREFDARRSGEKKPTSPLRRRTRRKSNRGLHR
jgi:hypothetical protein